MKNKKFLFIFAIIGIQLTTSCGTICNHTIHTTEAFGGTKKDVGQIMKLSEVTYKTSSVSRGVSFKPFFALILTCIDLPFSVVGDTVLFPMDYFDLEGEPPLFSSGPTDPQ